MEYAALQTSIAGKLNTFFELLFVAPPVKG